LITLVDNITVNGERVTDTLSVVLKPGADTVTISIERLPVTVRFDGTVAGTRQLHTESIPGAITFNIIGSSPGPFGFEAIDFARTDDGRLLSVGFLIEEVAGARGPSRVVHCTVTDRVDGQV
jgi:hypothetical protein